MTAWLLYGANGYTGELIAREAVRRGHKPILAGRSAERVEALAKELGCEARVFGLGPSPGASRHPLPASRGEGQQTSSPSPRDSGEKVAEGRMRGALDGIQLVLHCAGPFLHTSKPMVDACLAAGVHYLDITGEIAVFEAVLARDAEAKQEQVTLLPGVGFDVVPTDCLAAMLAARLPSAKHLSLAFYTKGSGLSRGTMKTMLESIGEGGAIRRGGRIVAVPVAHDVREIPFSCGPRTAMTIPWGDVSTSFHTTGIPNVRVYLASSKRSIRRAKWMGRLRYILGLKPIRRLLQKIAARNPGPNEEQRTKGRVYLWGEASTDDRSVSMTMTTPEGYAFTVVSAVNAVERVLADPRPGAFTPAKLLGPEFVMTVPGAAIHP